MRRGLLLTLLVVLPASSCVFTHDEAPVRDIAFEPGLTTKEDVIRALGAPTGVRRQGQDTVLVFSHGLESGTGYGIGTVVIGLSAESTQKGIDFLEVVIGPDRLVRSYRLARGERRTPVWPGD